MSLNSSIGGRVLESSLQNDARLNLNTLLHFVPLLLVYLIIRIAFFSGQDASDPLHYIQFANQIVEGNYSLGFHHYKTRYSVLIPTAISLKLFGVSELSALVWPLICSLVSLYLLVRFATFLGGLKAGLVSGYVFAFTPLDINYSMQVVPEPILAAMLTTCFYSVYRAHAAPAFSQARLWMILAGLSFWAAYSAKIVALTLVPLLAVYILCKPQRWKIMIWGALPALALAIPEYLYYYLESGDLLIRLHAVSGHNQSPAVVNELQDLSYRLLKAYQHMTIVPGGSFGTVFLLVWLASLYCLRYWRSYILIYLWFVGLIAYIFFGSSSLTEFTPLPVVDRYLLPALVPGLIFLGRMISDLWSGVALVRTSHVQAEERSEGSHGPHRAMVLTRALVVVVLGLTGVYSITVTYLQDGRSYISLTAEEMRQLAKFLRAQSYEVVYAGPRSKNMLDFALQYEADSWLKRYPKPAASDTAASYLNGLGEGAVLVVNWREVQNTDAYGRFSAQHREILIEAFDSEQTSPLWSHWAQPAELYYRLAASSLFWPTISRGARREFFEVEEMPNRGTQLMINERIP